MTVKNILSVCLMLIASHLFSQEEIYIASTISPDLTKNANAVIRLDETKIKIGSINNLQHSYKRVITVLNKNGDNDVDTYVYYDDKIRVKNLKAIVYDKNGNEIKKYKKSDFKDVAAVSSFSLYEDSRVLYLNYTPINYPYTVEFTYQTETNNTAWIPFWRPLEGYYLSTEKSTFEVEYDSEVGISIKENNFSDFNINGKNNEGFLSYIGLNLKAIKPEDLSPSFREFTPRLLITTENFYHEGFFGSTGNWESLGKWMYDNLLVGRDQVTEQTKQIILALVKDVEDPMEKAKIVYQYVQDNTRYISVQEGIGGNRPISALDVDKVKYGDCKGLTNYTKALLNSVGVESYYSRVYASSDSQQNVDEEFISFLGQTNHVILNIPTENNESVWLECTSQIMPFGFLGDFTDNRDVFVITPEGGKIVHTPKYDAKTNHQLTTGHYSILENGDIEVEVEVVSKGIQYDDKFGVEKQERRDQDVYYKKRWRNINNIEIKSIDFINDKDQVTFVEKLNFNANNYISTVGGKILFVPNALNKFTQVPDRYRNRKLPLSIIRGFVDNDEYEINLPEGFKTEFIPENKTIENKFGKYTVEIELISPKKLKYKRMFTISEGLYAKEDYKEYRNFLKEVSRNDNAKIILTNQ